MSEEWENELLLYLYDADGSPIGMQYRNTSYAEGVFDTYWYEKNLQGDIVAVYNQTGAKLITYTYDAWGNSTARYYNGGASSTAIYNYLRYRGYYLDTETGFYYLNSRYYDPAIGRWLNADAQISGIGGDLRGYNLFAYCFNNPVNMSDPFGNWPQWMKNVANAIENFFSPKTHAISGQFQDGIFRGSGSVTGGYRDIMARVQGDRKAFPSIEDPSVTAGAFGKLSIVNATGKIGVGNDNVAVSVKGVGDVLTTSAQAGLKYQDDFGVTAKAKAAVVSGRSTLEISIFGWQVEFGITGDALSVGAEATIGIFDDAFVAKANASLGFGGGFVLRVKPPQ